MRRPLYVLLAGVVMTASAVPRAVLAQNIVLGAKIGASFSTLSNAPHPDTDIGNLATFVGGGYVRVMFGRFGIQPEVLAVTKGADFDGPGDNDFELKIDYIEAALLAVMTFPYAKITPYLVAGPTFAIEVRCKTEFNDDDIDVQFDCDDVEARPMVFSLENFDIGAALGGGLLIPVGPGSALIEARYTHGLIDINDTEFDDTKIKNRSAYLLVGYAFRLGGW